MFPVCAAAYCISLRLHVNIVGDFSDDFSSVSHSAALRGLAPNQKEEGEGEEEEEKDDGEVEDFDGDWIVGEDIDEKEPLPSRCGLWGEISSVTIGDVNDLLSEAQWQ